MQSSVRGQKGEGAAENDGGGDADRACAVHFENNDGCQGQAGDADFQSTMKVEKIGAKGVEFVSFAGRMVMARMREGDGGQKAEADGDEFSSDAEGAWGWESFHWHAKNGYQ